MHNFAPFNRVKNCRYGTMAYNVNDRYLGRSLEAYGEFFEGEVEVFRQIVRPGDLVLDVGANIGAHTLVFARLVGPAGEVLAIEPQRILFQTLCANMALNSVTNVWCFPYAVGAIPGEAPAAHMSHASPGNFARLSVGKGDSERVKVLTLDGLNFSRCRLIKLDAEGAEEQVLRGAVHALARTRPILYIENDREEPNANLIRYVSSLGYEMYWHRPSLFNPNNHAGNPINEFGRIVLLNMLCIPKGSATRVDGLPVVVVPT